MVFVSAITRHYQLVVQTTAALPRTGIANVAGEILTSHWNGGELVGVTRVCRSQSRGKWSAG